MSSTVRRQRERLMFLANFFCNASYSKSEAAYGICKVPVEFVHPGQIRCAILGKRVDHFPTPLPPAMAADVVTRELYQAIISEGIHPIDTSLSLYLPLVQRPRNTLFSQAPDGVSGTVGLYPARSKQLCTLSP